MKTLPQQELVVNSGAGWIVFSPTTGQAVIWAATRDEASRWARYLIHETPGGTSPDDS